MSEETTTNAGDSPMWDLSQEEAKALFQTEWWKDKAPGEAALFQLQQRRCCMPFQVFHEDIEKLLQRPVWTHEFIDPKSLLAEAEGRIPKASFADVLAKIPAGKEVLIVNPEEASPTSH